MSKVFVTQETHYPFVDAENYGELVFMTHQDLHDSKGSLHNKELLAKLHNKLAGFDPKEDWIVITGSPYVSVAVFMMLGQMGVKAVKILRWDNRMMRYRPMYLELEERYATVQ